MGSILDRLLCLNAVSLCLNKDYVIHDTLELALFRDIYILFGWSAEFSGGQSPAMTRHGIGRIDTIGRARTRGNNGPMSLGQARLTIGLHAIELSKKARTIPAVGEPPVICMVHVEPDRAAFLEESWFGARVSAGGTWGQKLLRE